MIYELLHPFVAQFGALNVLRYPSFRMIMAVLTAMLLSFTVAPWFISALKRGQIKQVIRKDGPESHFSKRGTPTMGGSLILLAILLPTALWAELKNPFVVCASIVTAGYGLIGFIDDHLKISEENTRGLPGRYKLLGQVTIGTGVMYYLFVNESGLPKDWLAIRYRISVPFLAFDKHPIDVVQLLGGSPIAPWLYVAFAVFVVVATSNAVNLTDGLDGLAIGPVMSSAATYLIWAYVAGTTMFGKPIAQYLDIPGSASMAELSVFAAAMIGAGIGFLWYNTYPAQVFMGDVGSLALGGGIGMLAILTKNELLSVLIGGIFVVEAVSVITQVTSYKLFKKRIFLMAPIHHHFEKKGWPEPRIIVRFWIISVLLALIGLSSIKLR